jgi:hypothetical protein
MKVSSSQSTQWQSQGSVALAISDNSPHHFYPTKATTRHPTQDAWLPERACKLLADQTQRARIQHHHHIRAFLVFCRASAGICVCHQLQLVVTDAPSTHFFQPGFSRLPLLFCREGTSLSRQALIQSCIEAPPQEKPAKVRLEKLILIACIPPAGSWWQTQIPAEVRQERANFYRSASSKTSFEGSAAHRGLNIPKTSAFDLSQNIHFFEENSEKQARFVPQRQKLSWAVKNCQSRFAGYASAYLFASLHRGRDPVSFRREIQKYPKCHLA